MVGTDFSLSELIGCFITHAHQDHCRSVKPLVSRSSVPCYGLRETFDAIYVDDKSFVNQKLLHRVEPLVPLTCDAFTFVPFSRYHDIPNVGYVIRGKTYKLAYIIDTAYSTYKLNDLTHLLLGVNYTMDKMRTTEDENSRVARVVNTHMSLSLIHI